MWPSAPHRRRTLSLSTSLRLALLSNQWQSFHSPLSDDVQFEFSYSLKTSQSWRVCVTPKHRVPCGRLRGAAEIRASSWQAPAAAILLGWPLTRRAVASVPAHAHSHYPFIGILWLPLCTATYKLSSLSLSLLFPFWVAFFLLSQNIHVSMLLLYP